MRREATIYAGRPISAPAVAKPQHDGSWRAPTNAHACRSDSYHMRRRGARSFVDDLVLSRGVVLSRADLFCDLLRLSPMTRRFVRLRRTYLLFLLCATIACRSASVPERRFAVDWPLLCHQARRFSLPVPFTSERPASSPDGKPNRESCKSLQLCIWYE